MKIKHLLASALCLWAGAAVSAQAQVQTSLDDLILGFRATGGQGQNVNLEVDLGSISQFTNVAASAHFTTTHLAVADLVATYGSNWATRTDLYWGVVGSTGRINGGPGGQAASTLWATAKESTVGTLSTAWTQSSRGGQSLASASIEPLYSTAPGSLGGAAATTNSGFSSAINATLSGSYTAQDTTQFGTSFGFFNPSIDNVTSIPSGGYSASDLYQVQVGTGPGTYLGTFGLAANGNLTFSGSASFFTQAAGSSTFTTQPASQTIASGSTVVFSAAATGTPTPTYQWFLGGTAVAGATASRLVISNAASANAGNYTVVATNSSGATTSNTATLTVTATTNPGRLINLSVNTNAGKSQVLTIGFVVGGAGTTGSQPLLIRADGPALIAFGVSNTLVDPTLNVFSGQTSIASNDNWGTSATNVALVNAADTATFAFPLTSTTSLDAALTTSLAVSPGYTAQISGNTAASGAVLAELYDNTATYTATSPRLINVSSNENLAVGGSLIVGFSIGGTTSKTVLIRASGPQLALAPFNITGTMADPQLVLHQGGSILATNAAWGGDPQITAAANAVFAFTLTVPTSKDAVILTTLPPGVYSAVASSASGGGGTAIVEVYEVP